MAVPFALVELERGLLVGSDSLQIFDRVERYPYSERSFQLPWDADRRNLRPNSVRHLYQTIARNASHP